MISLRICIFSLGLILTGGSALFAQSSETRIDLLVSTAWLEENLADSSLVILQYGIQAAYKKGHIPGARQVSMKELIVDYPEGLSHELPHASVIEKVLRTWGISEDSKIVISYGNENALLLATRLFFTLDYAGLGGQVALLHGGFPAWKKENRILSTRESISKKGNIRIKVNKEVLSTKNDLLAHLNEEKVSIVDARPREQYLGNEKDANTDRRGHIKGAINIPFKALTTEDSPFLFKPKEELQDLFEEKQILSGHTLICYCGSGIWASSTYFVARLLGHQVRFYDASMEEWGKDVTLPMETADTLQ